MKAPWSRVREVFEIACDLSPSERNVYLDEACGDDRALREEVETLLANHRVSTSALDTPAADALRSLTPTLDGGEMPARIGPYRIMRRIASGGMGTVYLAERVDDQYRKRVAIKVIASHVPPTEAVKRRFRRERQTLANLEHPHIAALLDGGVTDDGRPYLVMEYIEGLPIDRFCDEKSLEIERRLRLFQSALSAVAFAHRNLVVHRDLKPSNILVTEDGVVKLLDFGIAKVLQPEDAPPEMTVTAQRLLTPEYASPEQIRGLPVTTVADVYSLGVVLYRLLTGRRPYRFKSRLPFEIERTVCEQDPLKPSTAVMQKRDTSAPEGNGGGVTQWSGHPGKLRKCLTGDLDAIVTMAMAKEAERRYASVEQFSEDIRRHLEGLPVRACRATRGYRAAKFVKRHRALMLAAAAIVLSLIAGLAGVVWQARIASRERDAALVAGERAARAAGRARTEARKAERINVFLNDMLASVHPERMGRDVAVREVLDEAARRIDDELRDWPEVEAAVRTTLGETYQGLGLYATAVDHLEAALRLAQDLHGEDHPVTADALHKLADLCDDDGQYHRAQALLRRALEIRKARFGEDHAVVAVTLNDLAGMLHHHGEHRQAAEVAREAVPLFTRLFAEEDVGVMNTHVVGLSAQLHAQGRRAEAGELLRGALAFHRKHLGDHPIVATDLQGLAEYLSAMREYEESETRYLEALDMRRRLHGDNHPEVADVLSMLADLYGRTDRLDKAESRLREALAIRRDTLGVLHPDVADTIFDLGSVAEGRGDLDAAIGRKRESLALRRRIDEEGEGDANLAYSHFDLARLLRKAGDDVEAEAQCRRALRLEREHPSPLPIALKLTLLAKILIDKGEPAETESLLRESIELRRSVMPDDHWTIAADEVALGWALFLMNRHDEAESLLLEGYERLHGSFGAEHWRTREAVRYIVDLYEGVGRNADADEWRERL